MIKKISLQEYARRQQRDYIIRKVLGAIIISLVIVAVTLNLFLLVSSYGYGSIGTIK